MDSRDFCDEGVKELSIAVVLQAVKDYKLGHLMKGKKGFKRDGQKILEGTVNKEIKIFFEENGLAQYYFNLAGLDWSPEKVLREIDDRLAGGESWRC